MAQVATAVLPKAPPADNSEKRSWWSRVSSGKRENAAETTPWHAIHAGSDFNSRWQQILMIGLLFYLVYIPFDVGFMTEDEFEWEATKIFMTSLTTFFDGTFLLDMVLSSQERIILLINYPSNSVITSATCLTVMFPGTLFTNTTPLPKQSSG